MLKSAVVVRWNMQLNCQTLLVLRPPELCCGYAAAVHQSSPWLPSYHHLVPWHHLHHLTEPARCDWSHPTMRSSRPLLMKIYLRCVCILWASALSVRTCSVWTSPRTQLRRCSLSPVALEMLGQACAESTRVIACLQAAKAGVLELIADNKVETDPLSRQKQPHVCGLILMDW